MNVQMKGSGKYPIESRLPYERTRVEEIAILLSENIEPVTVTISSVGGDLKLTMNDVINYMEFYAIPFSVTLSSFVLEGEKFNERKINFKQWQKEDPQAADDTGGEAASPEAYRVPEEYAATR